jgi:hypothetical protein
MALGNAQALSQEPNASAVSAGNVALLLMLFIILVITIFSVIIAFPNNLEAQANAVLQTNANTTVQNRTKYLLFQLMTADPAILGQPDTPHVGNKTLMDTFADQLLATIGRRGDHVKRQLGMVVGPLSWDLTDDQIRTVIQDAFAVAEEKDIAVGFHIDDSMFWNKREDLWSNRNNVEWSDWSGTVVPHRVIGFVPNHTELAPPMCYNSPAIIAETTRRARDVIGSEIKEGIDHLNSIGKPYLFAAIIVGWETRMQDDSYPPVYYGYCALHNLGYSASHPPKDMDEALERVVANWIALWAKSLEEAGIPKEKVFMHIAYPGELSEGLTAQLRQLFKGKSTDVWRDFYKGASPNILGLRTDANPGFSIYGGSGFGSLYKVLAAHGNPPWAICEGTDIDLSNAFSNLSKASTFTNETRPTPASQYAPSISMEQYLGHAFNHGADFANLFGWDKSHEGVAFARATMGPPAIRAYQKFLQGVPLSEAASSAALPETGNISSSSAAQSSLRQPPEQVQQLSEKMQRIQREVLAWVQAHPDRKPELESLFQQLDNHVRANDMTGAQQTADAILHLIGTDSNSD